MDTTEAKPTWARRREAVSQSNDATFKAMRTAQGRSSPPSWQSSTVKPNTTQVQKEAPLAGHAPRKVKGETEFKPRTQTRLVEGTRMTVGKDRILGVTKTDVAATKTTNDKFFSEAKDQAAIEQGRGGR